MLLSKVYGFLNKEFKKTKNLKDKCRALFEKPLRMKEYYEETK